MIVRRCSNRTLPLVSLESESKLFIMQEDSEDNDLFLKDMIYSDERIDIDLLYVGIR